MLKIKYKLFKNFKKHLQSVHKQANLLIHGIWGPSEMGVLVNDIMLLFHCPFLDAISFSVVIYPYSSSNAKSQRNQSSAYVGVNY